MDLISTKRTDGAYSLGFFPPSTTTGLESYWLFWSTSDVTAIKTLINNYTITDWNAISVTSGVKKARVISDLTWADGAANQVTTAAQANMDIVNGKDYATEMP